VWPELVPKWACTTDISVTIYNDESTEEGKPIVVVDEELKCNFQDSAYKTLTPEKFLITLSGKAYFNGDIAPSLAIISSGEVVVFGEKRKIYRGTKARNPDASVNYTLLELE
jgi:hypothetical protein